MTTETVTRVRCDRCGQHAVLTGNQPPEGYARLLIRTQKSIGIPTGEATRDLCTDCNSQLDRFMRGDRLESGYVDPASLTPR